jgi:hypothetical protein
MAFPMMGKVKGASFLLLCQKRIRATSLFTERKNLFNSVVFNAGQEANWSLGGLAHARHVAQAGEVFQRNGDLGKAGNQRAG